MDLTADQSRQIIALVEEWSRNKTFELETTFGPKGVVDSNTFLQIAQRLRSKGYEAMQQEDYLNIMTPNHIRFTLMGKGIMEAYCKDDTLDNKVYSVMRKEKIQAGTGVIDLPEYDVRFKIRREVELPKDDAHVQEVIGKWTTVRKAFRLIRRWSFKGNGVRIDLSMVRQTSVTPEKGEYKWTKRFLESNILKEVPRYEVEVELLHDVGTFTETSQAALKTLIRHVGEVLRGMQKSSLLIRKSLAEAVRAEYRAMIGSDRFRGVGPITLQVKNMVSEPLDGVVNVRTGFNVTDKADGLRAMGFVTKDGDFYLIDQSLNVYRTGLMCPSCPLSLVDGEWITRTKEGAPANDYMVFDIYYDNDGKDVSQLPFAVLTNGEVEKEVESRYNAVRAWCTRWLQDSDVKHVKNVPEVTEQAKLILVMKQFEFGTAEDPTSIFRACSRVLNQSRKYHTDGLILTSNSRPLPDRSGGRFEYQFKWKPAMDNTVDFLIRFERDTEKPGHPDKVTTDIHPASNEGIRYKTMRLYVGSKYGSSAENPRRTLLSGEPLVRSAESKRYRPVLFRPAEFSDDYANTCHVRVEMNMDTLEDYAMTEDSKEVITPRCIVEMRYDPTREPGWRWVPSRIRHDKTERLLKAYAAAAAAGDTMMVHSGTMNDIDVANGVWNSIHEPVTEYMIRSGNEQPSKEENEREWAEQEQEQEEEDANLGKKYYERKASKQDMRLIKGLQRFHNDVIKNDILLRNTLRYGQGGRRKLVIDYACGKAGDMYKWIRNRARAVVGVDIFGDNIMNPMDGAYQRYMGVIEESEPTEVANLPHMAFMIGDSSLNLVDGTAAGNNTEERDMLRTVFGRVPPEGPVPKYISTTMKDMYRDGADVSACMFALHYFFQTPETLAGFMRNVSETVKIGGYFIGCCFDGDRVFELLRDLPRGRSQQGVEGTTLIWNITKNYDMPELQHDESSIGLGIDVEFMSIGTKQTEYLVSFEFLKKKMSEIGFRLLTSAEQHEFGLRSSSSTFDKTYEEQARAGRTYAMPDAVKQFSFLNRWFIFKRQGATMEPEAKEEAAMEEEEVVNLPERAFGSEITKYNTSYGLYNTVESSKYSVLKPWHKQYVNNAFRKWFPQPSRIKHIVDATAHIGMDSIHMANLFPMATIHSYEVVPEIYAKLVYNIKVARKTGQIHPHNQDITTWMPSQNEHVDIMYMDPPWGGEEFAAKDQVDLYFQKEHNDPNEAKNLNAMVDRWMDSHQIDHFVIKVPPNFNRTYLESKYPVERYTVYGRGTKGSQPPTAFFLMHITSPFAKPIELDVEEEAEEKKADASIVAASAAAMEAKPLTSSAIFRFGMGAKSARDILKVKHAVKGPDGKETMQPDLFISQWLAPYALFAIPDPDMKDADGRPVLYPSIEHYMAAMKIRFASNKLPQDAALFARDLVSTTSKLHALYAQKRMALIPKGKPFVESDAYYELCIEEATAVKQLMNNKKTLAASRIEFDEGKWVSIKDELLMDALRFRWAHDRRFRGALEAARAMDEGRGKYLLYSLGAAKNATAREWGGTFRTNTQTIEGENKIGKMMMEIAGYRQWL